MVLSPGQQQDLRSLCGERIGFDVDMARHCTLRAGGKAAALAEPDSVEQASRLIRYLSGQDIAWRSIGRGSNLLVRDAGYPGVLIRFAGRGCRPGETDPDQVKVESGCMLAGLLGFCQRQGLTGLEFLTGIPGSVGGAVRMNAGAFGGELSDYLSALSLIGPEGEDIRLTAGQWQAGYRTMTLPSLDWGRVLLLEATVTLSPGKTDVIMQRMDAYRQRRRALRQPALPSAGSFFKNPPGDFAGRLIEQTGLKGMRVGGAMVSGEHANFIVNDGGASASEIIALMELVQEKVAARTGIFLEPEVHIL